MFDLFKKQKKPMVSWSSVVDEVIKINQLKNLSAQWNRDGKCDRVSISEDRSELTVEIDLVPMASMLESHAKHDPYYYHSSWQYFVQVLTCAIENDIRAQIDKMNNVLRAPDGRPSATALLPEQPEGSPEVVVQKPVAFMSNGKIDSGVRLITLLPQKVTGVIEAFESIKVNLAYHFAHAPQVPVVTSIWVLDTILREDIPPVELPLAGFKNTVVQDMYNITEGSGNPTQRVSSFVNKGVFYVAAHGLKETVIYSEAVQNGTSYTAFCSCSEPKEDLSLINRLTKHVRPGLNTFDLGEGWVVRWYKHEALVIHHSPEY